MRSLVILRRVLDPAGIVAHRRLRRIFVNRERYLIEPADHCALEAALRIKDAVGGNVVVASGQPEPDEDTLRRGVAMGADRGVYLCGERFEGADDAVVARALRAVIDQLGAIDLVMAGATTLNTGQGQLGGRLAELLGWPHISGAFSAEPVDGRMRTVCRRGSDDTVVEADLPAVVLMAPGALKPRYPDGVRLINVYRGNGGMEGVVERWHVDEHLSPTETTPLLEFIGRDFPPERQRGELIEGTLDDVARTMAEALRSRLRGWGE